MTQTLDYVALAQDLRARVLDCGRSIGVSRGIVAVYVYGSAAEAAITGRPDEPTDIDCLIVVDGNLSPGEMPVTQSGLLALSDGLVLAGIPTLVITNGVMPPARRQGFLYLDVIGDGTEQIRSHAPSSKVTAQKPRVLVLGSDVYAPLEHDSLSKEDRVALLQTMERYVRREFFNRTDAYAAKAIAKAAMFLMGLLDPEAVKTNHPDIIAKRIRQRHPMFAKWAELFEPVGSGQGEEMPPCLVDDFESFAREYRGYCSHAT